jgi:signal transduction histidine kinase
MKKRIILGLAIFTSIFVLGGIYLIVTIEKGTSTLSNLITLHQVEILREQLLNDARAVESYLSLQQTKFSGNLSAVIGSVVVMEGKANQCLGCHHTAAITDKLQNLKAHIILYKEILSRLLDIRTNQIRLQQENKLAFEQGHELVTLLDEMTALTQVRLEKRTQVTLAEIGDMKKLIFIFIVLGPIFAIGLAVIFTQGLTRPLAKLLWATRKLKSGDMSFRVQGLTDEFGEMAAAFNEMAVSLNEHMYKMQRAEQMTVVGEMAARLIHEIKNPLAGIKGAIQVFQEGAETTQEERGILSQAIDDCQRVESLLKNLLNFAKPPKPQLLPVNMNDILEASLRSSLPRSFSAPNSPQEIRVVKQLDPRVPLIMADPMEMQQVFLNLLINAVQAMPAGGTLTVRTVNNAPTKEIQIEITDTGKGMSDETREKIFQPFFTTKSKGSGLGLAISRQFIEMHGGTISADNNPQGGSIFRIVLPCTEVEEAPPQTLCKE